MLQRDPSKKLAEAWEIFASGNIGEAYTRIPSAIRGKATSQSKAKLLLEIGFLFSYNYPEVKDIPEKSKREFAQIVAWNHLLDSSMLIDHIWWFKKAYMAPFLGNTYFLDINTKNLIITTDIYLPDYTEEKLSQTIFNDHRYKSWPELQKLQNLSVTTRSIFIHALRYAQVRFGGLADINRITIPDLAESKRALSELSLLQLIESDPSISDLLMSKSLVELKHYAAKNGIDFSGIKSQLIKNIISGVSAQQLEEWLTTNGQAKYIKLMVSNFPLLKKYVMTESALLETYWHWVYEIQYLKKSSELIRIEKHEKLNSNPYKPMEPWKPSLAKPIHPDRVDSPKMELLKQIWDESCDAVLQKTIAKYAWDWEDHIEEALNNQLLPGKLHDIKELCTNNANLYRISELRVIELDLNIRRPSLLICKGCGIQFMDWSLDPRISEEVSYKIHFCENCYITAFCRFNWGMGRPVSEIKNKELALKQLFQVANILKIIPGNDFPKERNLARHLAELSDEAQILLINTMIEMPPYKLYVETFGSWLNALILSNVLEDGTRRTPRGIQCIALDGHTCLSLSEKAIDDWFTENHIPHVKEPRYPFHSELNLSSMRADWKVKDVLMTPAGLMNEPDYASKMDAKLKLCREANLRLIILYPEDILNLDTKLEELR